MVKIVLLMLKIPTENAKKFFRYFSKNKHFNFGIPLVCFVGICWLVLSHTATVRYDFRKGSHLDKEELKKLGYKVRDKEETLEEIYEKYKEMDIDNWENIRGPRLFEETPPTSS